MICRMGEGFYIQPGELDISEQLGNEYEIAKAVFGKISRRFFIKVPDEEIRYFSLYLKGQGNNRDSDTITQEMDNFISEAFEEIRRNFGVDFTDNINLRITLALHCMSLSIRIKYDMQVKMICSTISGRLSRLVMILGLILHFCFISSMERGCQKMKWRFWPSILQQPSGIEQPPGE